MSDRAAGRIRARAAAVAVAVNAALAIAWKDARAYFFKAPNFTYGLFIPVFMFVAVSLNRTLEPHALVSGLVSLSVLFSTTSIEAVAVVIEKEKGTLLRLAAAPVTFLDIVLGKTVAGTAFGILIASPLVVVAMIAVPAWAALPWVVGVIAAGSFTFSALGVLVSSFSRWTPEAQMLCNLIRFPMPFFSGVFIPVEQLGALQPVTPFMPLTHLVDGIAAGFEGTAGLLDGLAITGILAAFAVAFLLASAAVLRRATARA